MIVYYGQAITNDCVFESVGKDKIWVKDKLMGSLRRHGFQQGLEKNWHKGIVRIKIRPLDSRGFYKNGELF